MNCQVFREMLDPYLEESLDEDRRVWFRDHLQRCEGCRGWAIEMEPSLLFTGARGPEADPARVEECAVAVSNQIRQRRLEGRLRGRRRPWLAAAAAAVMMIGGGLAWQLLPSAEPDPSQSIAETVAGDESGRTPPSVEVEMDGDDVRVYQFAADDADMAVVFVVDPSLEL